MRTEKEMYQLIMKTAEMDKRIRAVYLNGSRTNPNAPADPFQDYDIVYVVEETKPFYEDESWLDGFGQILYMQRPNKMDQMRGRICHWEDSYCWLILFQDGNRIDVSVSSIKFAQKDILSDRLCKILLDKDGILPEMPAATDADHYVKKPSKEDFLCDCNNFWWCLNNVAKGLWREEIPYTMDMLNCVVRPHLINVLSWKIGMEHHFACSVGKSGKYMYRFLPEEMWKRFLSTYTDSCTEHMWQGVFTLCDLFDEAASQVADGLGFPYNREEAAAGRSYLERVYHMRKVH